MSTIRQRRKFPTLSNISIKQILTDQDLDQDQFWKKYQRMTQKTKDFIISATSFSTYFSIFLGSTKGRDKFLAFFQYCFQFYCSCSQYSSIQYVRSNFKRGLIPTVNIAKNLYQNISQARKIFRLLKFLDEVKGMGRIYRSQKAIPIKYFSIVTHIFSFFYYLIDNQIWFVNVLIMSDLLSNNLQKQLKIYKNYCSLARCLSYLLLLYQLISRKNQKNQNKTKSLQKSERQLFQKQAISLVRGRRKVRFYYLQIIVTVLRLLMLVKALKLRGWNMIDPLFVSVCGMIAASLNLFKALYEKKIVVR